MRRVNKNPRKALMEIVEENRKKTEVFR